MRTGDRLEETFEHERINRLRHVPIKSRFGGPALVVLLAPSWIFGALEISEQLLQVSIQEVVGLLANALDMLACWLLFFGKGARSFFHGRAGSVSKSGRVA